MCLAVPGKVTSIWEQDDTPMGQVDFGGVTGYIMGNASAGKSNGDFWAVTVGFRLPI